MKLTRLFMIVFALMLLTPFMHSDDLYNGINSAKQIWFYGSVSVIFIVYSAGFIVQRTPRNPFRATRTIKLNVTDLFLTAFYLYFLIRSLATPYTPVLHNQKFLNWTLLIIVYFIIRQIVQIGKEENATTKNRFIKSILWIIILTGLVEAIWGLLQLYGFRRSFNYNFKIRGSFFNPAPYALYLAVVFPLALGTYMNSIKSDFKDLKEITRLKFSSIIVISKQLLVRYISLLTVITIVLVLPATMIRASWLGVLAGSVIVLNYKYALLRQLRIILTTPARKAFLTGTIILFSGLIVSGLYFLKEGSSTGKLLIWEVTLGKIAEKPFFGHGVGRFEAEYNNWQAEYFKNHADEMDGPKGMVAGNTKYCFNEYLEMASELGIFGLLLFISIIVPLFLTERYLVMTLWRQKIHSAVSDPDSVSTLYAPCLISLLVCASVSFPFYSLPTLILLFIILTLVSSYRAPILTFRLPPVTRMSLSVTITLWLICGIFLADFAKKQYGSYYKMDEAVMLYQTGSYDEACESFSQVNDHMEYNGPFLQYYAKASLMAERYEESMTMYERAKKYTSDDMLYCSLGDANKAVKRYDEAEEAYMYASFMVPHKLYPLYLLTTLYDETDQGEKAVAVAKKVIINNIKVESEASEEIKEKMNEIINKYKNNL